MIAEEMLSIDTSFNIQYGNVLRIYIICHNIHYSYVSISLRKTKGLQWLICQEPERSLSKHIRGDDSRQSPKLCSPT